MKAVLRTIASSSVSITFFPKSLSTHFTAIRNQSIARERRKEEKEERKKKQLGERNTNIGNKQANINT
ncbi:hypothetical protein VTL71DRAFT_2889 [Oculimacula yallundae]|uniref:Uncharacterized protein n=1 Tax=Oculimacula yallundae TaxID=86028 RepID=A0ABR4C5K3_9HELO